MKAVIIKNDEFQTIGFYAYFKGTESTHNTIIFKWGILAKDYYFSKEIELNDERLEKVFALCRLDTELSDYDHIPYSFMSNSISREQHEAIQAAAKDGKCREGYDCREYTERKKAIEARIKEIINEF